MATVKIYLVGGQVIEFEGEVQLTQRVTGTEFTYAPERGTTIKYINPQAVVAVTETETEG